MSLNERSLRNLEGVHTDLVRVVKAAAEREPFLVTEGLRNLERQRQLVKAGKSKTLNSRHISGHAVDLCDPDGCYDLPDMKRIAEAMKAAAAELGVPIEWGGDWKRFVDTPHFQLPWKSYPANSVGIVDKVKEAVSKPGPIAGIAGGAGVTLPNIPTPPDLGQYTAWRAFGETATDLVKWCWAHPVIPAALAVWVLVLVYLPKLRAPWVQSSD